jgi:hypothetical protein
MCEDILMKDEFNVRDCSRVDENGEYDDAMFAIEQFVSYPAKYLINFDYKICSGSISRDDMLRLIILSEMDTFVLHRALALGVHPITGGTWYRDDPNAVERVEKLVDLNNRRIARLKEMLKK